MLGAVFALGWAPCTGPTLAAVLVLASTSVDPQVWRGVVLAVAYGLGLGLPFILIAAGLDRAGRASGWLRRHQRTIQVVGGVLLAVSRAIGETMIVVMAAGLSANMTANPFASVTTVTVQIVQLLTGDQEFDSAKTLAAFALGLLLFVITLILNLIALRFVRKYREAYE